MDKIRVGICDDEIILLPQIAAYIKNLFQISQIAADIHTFSSANVLLDSLYSNLDYKIFFLDIDMPQINGISLAQKIRQKNPDIFILFISGKEEFVYDTFQTRPLAFIRKSFFSSDIKKAMTILKAHLQPPRETVISFRDELGHDLSLNLSRIMYVEAKEKYQNIVSIDDSELIRCPIQDLEKAASPYHFCRIHRGYLVNFHYVYRIDAHQIILDTGKSLPLSRHRRNDVEIQYLNFVRTNKH